MTSVSTGEPAVRPIRNTCAPHAELQFFFFFFFFFFFLFVFFFFFFFFFFIFFFFFFFFFFFLFFFFFFLFFFFFFFLADAGLSPISPPRAGGRRNDAANALRSCRRADIVPQHDVSPCRKPKYVTIVRRFYILLAISLEERLADDYAKENDNYLARPDIEEAKLVNKRGAAH